MIDVFEIGASLNVHGNGMDFMKAFSGALAGAHGQLEALEKKLGATKGAFRDLMVGAGEVFAGAEILKGITHLAEAGKELNHQQSMLMRNGVTQRDVMRETSSIYKDMLTAVPTASAVDFLRTLGELKTVKGSIAGAREALTQSLKIEGLIGNSTGKSAEGQGYDFWRAVEDKGIIQNKAKTDAMLNRMVQGTIATGGKIGGNDWFTYARRAGSAWMGDDIDALPLQLMEMQTLGPSGAGVARRAFANRTEGAIKLTEAQQAGWNQIGMLQPGGRIKDSALEQSRPDLFMGEVIEALKVHDLDTEAKVKAWSAHALHGKDADYFMTAYAGMTEVDPESGLTRLQKERRNMGEAQPLDQAYKTMMGTDFEANMHALQEQWKSFTEAVGGPAAKAMIPVLQGVTSFVTGMANFADKNKDLTQAGIDIAAVAAGLLVLGGSLRLMRGSLRLMGGGLFGMGRNALGFGASATALNGSATQLDASALALKEAAAALGRNGLPTGNALKEAEDAAKKGAGGIPYFAGAGVPLVGGMAILAGGAAAGAMNSAHTGDFGQDAGTWGGDAADTGPLSAHLRHRRAHNRQSLGARLLDLIPGFASHPAAPNTDGNALHRGDEAPAPSTSIWHRIFGSAAEPAEQAGKQFGELQQRTGVVLASFTTLKDVGGTLNTQFGTLSAGSTSLDNVFKILEATGLGAARALASVAISGGIAGTGIGGGSGLTNASFGGGSPDLSGASRGGGPGIGHFFSASEREANIRSYAASIGVSPDVAMAVAKSEGFGKFSGDRGTSFGDLQMHIGGGLGDFYRRATGKDPSDPHNELELDRFALDQAKRGGWGPWHGAAHIGVHGMYGIGSAPVPVAGPPTSRTVSPGRPAGGSGTRSGATMAENMPPIIIEHHSHTYMDTKKVAHEVTRHQVADARFKRSQGGTDTYGRRAHPGSEVMDA